MIDLRSDTVTRPSRAMLEAMMTAQSGTTYTAMTVNALTSAAPPAFPVKKRRFYPPAPRPIWSRCFSHCERGEEYIVGGRA